MTKVSKIIAIALLCVGILMAVLAFLGSKTQPAAKMPVASQPEKPKFSVAVAARDLPAGHVLAEGDVRLDARDSRPGQSFSGVAGLQGRSTATAVVEGEVLTPPQLLDGVVGRLSAGQRAVSIKVDEASAVGHQVKPGDWVDIFVVLKKDTQEVEESHARLLLLRKQVLAYGADVQASPEPEAEDGESKKTAESKEKAKTAPNDRRTAARTAVLAVQMEEVNRLLLAEQYGQVQLALRSPLDQLEPSADMLKQIAGISLDLSNLDEAAAVNQIWASSLAGLTLKDMAKGVQPKLQKASDASAKAHTASNSRPRVRLTGAHSVEVIRGTRTETLRY